MSERLNCLIDDPIFDNISSYQWSLYAELINQDQKEKLDYDLLMYEYLASFWNSEAVKKIKESREHKEKHKFKNDDEFEEDVVSGKYKQNELLDAITKIRKDEVEKRSKLEIDTRKGKSKLPTNLSSIINKYSS